MKNQIDQCILSEWQANTGRGGGHRMAYVPPCVAKKYSNLANAGKDAVPALGEWA